MADVGDELGVGIVVEVGMKGLEMLMDNLVERAVGLDWYHRLVGGKIDDQST